MLLWSPPSKCIIFSKCNAACCMPLQRYVGLVDWVVVVTLQIGFRVLVWVEGRGCGVLIVSLIWR